MIKMKMKRVKGLAEVIGLLSLILAATINLSLAGEECDRGKIAGKSSTCPQHKGRGGGTGYTLINDEFIIADAWVKRLTSPQDLSRKVKKVLTLSKDLLAHFAGANSRGDSVNDFFARQIMGENVEYRFLEKNEFEKICQSIDRMELEGGPHNSVGQDDYGCTVGLTTFFLKSRFQKMNISEAVRAIWHERLHFFNDRYIPEVLHEYIADITVALKVLFEHYAKQEQGIKTYLSPEEMHFLNRLMITFKKFGLSERGGVESADNDYYIHRFGGGLVEKSLGVAYQEKNTETSLGFVSPKAFIGINTLLRRPSGKMIIRAGAVIQRFSYWIEKTMVIDSGVVIRDSSIEAGSFYAQENVKTEGSKLYGKTILLKKAAQIIDSNIRGRFSARMEVGKYSILNKMNFMVDGWSDQKDSLIIGDNIKLENLQDTTFIGKVSPGIYLGPLGVLIVTLPKIILGMNTKRPLLFTKSLDFINFKKMCDKEKIYYSHLEIGSLEDLDRACRPNHCRYNPPTQESEFDLNSDEDYELLKNCYDD